MPQNFQSKPNSLKLSFWNVENIFSKKIPKLHDDKFLDYLSQGDIVGLTETQTPDKFDISGYKTFCKSRKKAKRARKFSGGLAFIVKNELMKGCQIVPCNSPDALWLKLDRNFFCLSRDIFVCVVYISPANSTFSAKLDYCPFEALELDIENFSKLGNIIVGGDLNARTSNRNDFISHDSHPDILERHVPLPSFYDYNDESLPMRINQDAMVNSYGNKLLNLCQSHNLTILNGRKAGDSLGYFTCYKHNGSSVIDYILTSPSLFSSVLYFKVGDLTPFSDHCMVYMQLLLSSLFEQQPFGTSEDTLPLQPIPSRFIWDDNSAAKFKNSLERPDIANQISDFMKESISTEQDGIDTAVKGLSDIFRNAAVSCLSVKGIFPRNRKTRNKKKMHKKWFDSDCIQLRRNASKIGRQLQQKPFSNTLRSQYYVALKEYKKGIKRKKREHINSLVNTILHASKDDPKLFWASLKKLKSESKQATVDENCNIAPSDWFNHFKKLNEAPVHSAPDDALLNSLSDLEKLPSFNELDVSISQDELHTAIKSLRCNKATGLDGISNEMLKNCNKNILIAVLKLFNYILSSSIFPSDWGKSIISVIFKSGDKGSCDNYRGISISSCIGKLFAVILNKRLTQYALKHNLIPKNQIGFMPRARTSDHIFTLKCAVEKYLRKKKRLYVCFVDLRKAFDSIWHDALFFKLQKLGINGLFKKIIHHMYLSNKLCVRTSGGLTPFFDSKSGVRQGCSLSPMLFNLFISDLSACLDNANSEPVHLFSKSLSHLLFADDLVLLSESANGLQSCLDTLNRYCIKWKLSVNTKKTKIVIFSNSPSRKNIAKTTFTIGTEEIEIVDEYKYLGVIFVSSGSFQNTKSFLEKKAKRSLFGMHKYINDCSLPVSTCLALFDKLIQPISTYAAEVWAPFCINLNNIFKKDLSIHHRYLEFPGTHIHLRFCKRQLKIHDRSVNLSVLGELGQVPSIVSVLVSLINFWLHILDSKDSLLFDAYLCSYDQYFQDSKNKWFQIIHYLSNRFPILKQFWENHAIYNDNPNYSKFILKQMKKMLSEEFQTYWESEIDRLVRENPTGGRLKFYTLLMKDFSFKNYIDVIKNNLHSQIFTQIRTSSHKLGIEIGRHYNIPREARLCTHCNQIDDEIHFILYCLKHSESRKILFNSITNQFHPDFLILSDTQKIQYLLNNVESASLVASFLFNAYNSR